LAMRFAGFVVMRSKKHTRRAKTEQARRLNGVFREWRELEPSLQK
jgi:hypothetical protein